MSKKIGYMVVCEGKTGDLVKLYNNFEVLGSMKRATAEEYRNEADNGPRGSVEDAGGAVEDGAGEVSGSGADDGRDPGLDQR